MSENKQAKRAAGRFGPGGRHVLAGMVCLALLAGCTGITPKELQSLGSELHQQKVDFAGLEKEAQRARAAYAREDAIRAAYPHTVRVATPGSKDVQYFIERDEAARTQYLVVRGTADNKNLSEDLAVRVREDRKTGLPVHAGFEADAQAVYADAKPYLKRGYETRFVGHSLGGAVAAILAVYAKEDGYDVESVVTFGQPRFTTASGAAKLAGLPLTRVVDENDVIPMLPPGLFHNGPYGPYEQVGPEIILLEGPRYVYLPSHDATRLSAGELWRELGVADLPDHKMQNYLKRLEAKRSGAIEVAYDERERYVAKPGSAAAAALR